MQAIYEHWQGITNYPNYEVSNLGNVRHTKTKRNLKPFTDRLQEYPRVMLINDEGRHKFMVHILVANAFLADKSLRLTDREREYVAKFREAYSIKDGCNQTREDIEKSCGDDTTYKLAHLKNKIVMQTTLYWDFTLETMTSEGFLTRGLKASKTNLWL